MAFVQATCFSASGATGLFMGTSSALTTTSGDTLAVFIALYSSDSLDSVVDNKGNTYAQQVAFTATTNGPIKITLWSAENIVGGTGHTVTVTGRVSVGGMLTCGVMELGGLVSAPAFDVGVGADQAYTTAASSGSVTTTQASETLIGGIALDYSSTATVTAGTDWTIPTGGSLVDNIPLYVEHRQVAATGTYEATGTLSVGDQVDAMIGSFKDAAVVPLQYFRPASDVAAGGWTVGP